MNAIAAQVKPIRYRTIALLLIGLLAWLIAVKLVNPVTYADSDFFSFWLSGRFVLTGQNPYSSAAWVAAHQLYGATWVSDPTFIYPLPLSLFFAPLAWLPLYQAYILWVALSQLMIVAAGVLLLRLHAAAIARSYVLPLLAGAALFRPTILNLLNGQLTAPLLLLMAAVVYLWSREKWLQGGMLLPLLMLKPGLGAVLIGMLSLYLLLRRQSTALVAEAAVGLLLLLVGFVQDPHWMAEYLGIGTSKVALNIGLSPTLWGMSAYACRFSSSCAVTSGAIVAALVLCGYIVFLIRQRGTLSPAWAVGLSVTVMLLITPYTWQYDQLLLLVPIVGVTMALARSGIPFLANALLFLGLDVIAFLLLWVSGNTGLGIWGAFVPLCVLLLAAWAIRRERAMPN